MVENYLLILYIEEEFIKKKIREKEKIYSIKIVKKIEK